jgi:prepilin-type processing-associated H-X9-DG protein
VSYAINSDLAAGATEYWAWPLLPSNAYRQAQMAGPASTVMYCEEAYSLPGGYSIPGLGITYVWNAAEIQQGLDLVTPTTCGTNWCTWGMADNPALAAYAPWAGVQSATGQMLNCSAGWADGAGSDFNSWTSARHSEGSNFALCDGHAKWYRSSQVSAGPGLSIQDLQAQYGGATDEAAVINGCNTQQAEPVEYLGNSAVSAACGNPAITFNAF